MKFVIMKKFGFLITFLERKSVDTFTEFFNLPQPFPCQARGLKPPLAKGRLRGIEGAKPQKFSKSLLFLTILILGLLATGFSQTKPRPSQNVRETQQFRVAQRYQRNNQHENAIRILEQLYKQHPGSPRYYQALLISYLKLSRFDAAKTLVRRQQVSQPGNPYYEMDYGNVIFKAGEVDEARRIWRETLKKYQNDVGVYTTLANIYAENRMYGDAAKMYRDAYKKYPDKAYLLQNLADFYRRRLQYQKALRAYLAYVEKHPQNYQNAIRSVLSFQLEKAQVDSLGNILENARKGSPGSLETQILAAKFYQKHQRYDQAFVIIEKLENSKTHGQYLAEFARAVQADSLYEMALQAYQHIIDQFPGSNYTLSAYLGAATCNLEIAKQRNDQKFARQAIEMIEKVQKKYPAHPQLANLSLLEGDIYRQFFFDIDRAIQIYLQVGEKYRKKTTIHETALLNAGTSYIIRGDLAEAKAVLEKISDKQKPDALFYLAKIAFYQADYAKSLAFIDEILQLQGYAGRTTNDALELQALLNNESLAPKALKKYAAADWLLFQQKKSEAINKLQSALEDGPPPYFRIKILFKAANLAAEIGKFPEALDFCNQVIQDPSLQLYADEALFIMAGIVDHKLKDIAKAYDLYDQILANFPDSQFTNVARQRLKELRHDYPELIP